MIHVRPCRKMPQDPEAPDAKRQYPDVLSEYCLFIYQNA